MNNLIEPPVSTFNWTFSGTFLSKFFKTFVVVLVSVFAYQAFAAEQPKIAVKGQLDKQTQTLIKVPSETHSKAPRNAPRSFQNAISISVDNDLFVPSQTDKDYTAGLALTYHGQLDTAFADVLVQPLAWIDSALSEHQGRFLLGRPLSDRLLSQRFELGSYGFTPENIESNELDRSDRPYASLVYVALSKSYRAAHPNNSWTSTLTFGVLGSNIFEQAQAAIHTMFDGDEARGWRAQISDGGELTARYQLAYHQGFEAPFALDQAKLTYFGSVGYISELGFALGVREGLISSPDYRFNPELISYGEGANAVSGLPEGREHYFWGGIGLKLRAYNAFLQGQFRHSEHTLSATQLNRVLAHAWAGYTFSLLDSTKLSYVIRAQSSEIKQGTGDRHLLWGGFVFSHALN